MGHSSSSLSSLERGTASIERDDGARSYAPPSSPVRPMAHYVFLVHGWMGNDLEQDYLSRALHRRAGGTPDRDDDDDDDDDVAEGVVPPDAKRARQDGDADAVDDASENNVVVYSPRCNVGRTHDGIRAGGARLANEVVEFVRSDVTRRLLLVGGDEGRRDDDMNDDAMMRSPPNEEDVHVTYSIVGNSLGGLYARYAISLLPYRLSLSSRRERHPTNERTGLTTNSIRLNLHPNVFCTTATPHLGVSRHTYLPLPRIAETIIGTGMRATGRDLFRLKSDSSLRGRSFISTRSDSSVGIVDNNTDSDGVESGKDDDGDDERMECVIRNMCLQDRYLSPLRCFRHRIAYANAYGTDFQVPTSTAAFLNESSGVAHRLVASRSENGAKEGGGGDEEGEGGVPSFIVAVCRTEKQDSLSLRSTKSYGGGGNLDDDLLLMSQSLDALGWTKVFVDVRDCLPVAGMPTPSWLRSSSGTLDNLIRERMGLRFRSLMNDTNDIGCILTSQELAQSTNVSDSINIPLGHAVMVANSKSERYAQLNRAGRPVMDKLATDMMNYILKFE
ncbi:hypothetical protein ACHAW5_004678 [Stephanodiscus triporus]|uniref:DUF676 domain-containing protein n=1 Tax=Stephanodiscus triporus TaxID=2934178 RepID=A0ABD3NN37_9STRA